jgi:RNA polymerase II subunit A small phosphatase-like protein
VPGGGRYVVTRAKLCSLRMLASVYTVQCSELTRSLQDPNCPPESSALPLPIEMARGMEERPQAAAESSKEKDTLTSDDGATKKSRGLLPVPSRSSSQRVQASPAVTGLSGATANDPRDSIGGRSKESRASMLRPNHNGSASSNRLGAGTGPTATPGNSEPNSPAVTSQKKKKGGLFALFGCCGVPDSANGLDTEPPVPNHKLDKIPARPATASRRTATPSEQPSGSRTQLSEKEHSQPAPLSQGPARNGKRISGVSTQDQSTVGGERDNESKQTTLVGAGSSSPVISVEPPHAARAEAEKVEEASEQDAEGDVSMPDAETSRQVESQGATVTADEPLPRVPPPPPGPVPAVPNAPFVESNPAFVPEQAQRALLPPLAPELRGRKCLVLDLDETLVHSSFKVSNPFKAGAGNEILTATDPSPSRLHNTRRNRGQLP